ncbi:MAG TPA: YXWGXW repeat-containing protein, partial [Candidatus Angelobacter sp.]|nr:YXWGXW repeat-containing protein [Candidatus Angelobacter sp.]
MSQKTGRSISGFPPFPVLAISALVLAVAGCHSTAPPLSNNTNQAQNAAMQAADESQDPAEQANLAPAIETAPPPSGQRDEYNAPESNEQAIYAPGPPRPLPDYEQPEVPGPDYIWTPGYWNYASTGYYWVPGTWVLAPYVGALWTPGYWGFYNGRYLWH